MFRYKKYLSLKILQLKNTKQEGFAVYRGFNLSKNSSIAAKPEDKAWKFRVRFFYIKNEKKNKIKVFGL